MSMQFPGLPPYVDNYIEDVNMIMNMNKAVLPVTTPCILPFTFTIKPEGRI